MTDMADQAATTETKKTNKKTLVGLIASDKMDKTVVVEVVRRMRHPVYHKYIQSRQRYKAHDEANSCKIGDRVLIEECRPMSRDKRWRVKEILERAV
jgi:small subunit ribosomal protein S17